MTERTDRTPMELSINKFAFALFAIALIGFVAAFIFERMI